MRGLLLATILVLSACAKDNANRQPRQTETQPATVRLEADRARPDRSSTPTVQKSTKAESTTRTYSQVVLGSTRTKTAAIRLAKRASSRLTILIAEDTLRTPPPQRRHVGDVVTVTKGPAGFQVSSFLGADADWTKRALTRARRYFPTAKLEAFGLADDRVDSSFMAYTTTRLIILASHKDYRRARQAAESIARKTGIPFSTRGMVYDAKRGLVWPDDWEDDIYAGAYYGRRYNDCGAGESQCLSIERSDFYSGLEPGYYIVVGGLMGDNQDRMLARYKRAVPDAYAKKTVVYLGCVH